MIQTYNDILQEIQSFNEDFAKTAQIQKLYSSSQFICMQIREPGKSKFLYFGRGKGYEGFWSGLSQIPSPLRKRDQFLEYMRRYLSGSVLTDVDMDPKDRVVRIEYRRFGKRNRFMFFYRGRELYFSNIYYDEKVNYMRTFCSWIKGVIDEELDDFNMFNELGHKEIGKDKLAKERVPIENLLLDEKKRALSLLSSGKSRKFLKRKINNIQGDIDKVNKWPELVEFVENCTDLSKLPMKNTFATHRLNFKSKEHFTRRDELYLKIKKLKKAQKILALRFSDTQENLTLLPESSEEYENKLKVIKPIWSVTSDVKSAQVTNEKGYKVIKLDGIQLGVGLSAIGNDQVRKEWAKKTDFWFHLEGDKSPHIIIKLDNQLMDLNVFETVTAAMLHFVGSSATEARLLYTQVKNLKGVKGAAGKVTIKKEKKISVILNKNWNDIITS
jgi:predicted ribosome quality control (RQC) complex YloA/Tae2 family protein